MACGVAQAAESAAEKPDDYAEKTLAYVHRLWGREVALESVVNGKRTILTYGERGFSAKASK